MSEYRGVAEDGAGSATLPFAGIYAPSGSGFYLRELKVFTDAANAARIRIRRATTAGTWTAEEEIESNEGGPPPLATVVKSATSTAPTMGDPFDIGAVGAAIASGFHYVYFSDVTRGIWVPAGTGNGIVLIESADTANEYDVAFVWEE